MTEVVGYPVHITDLLGAIGFILLEVPSVISQYVSFVIFASWDQILLDRGPFEHFSRT